jgi:hypothetical protein
MFCLRKQTSSPHHHCITHQGEAELDAELAAELEAVASGLYDSRAVDSIVKDLMSGDDEADEAEVPRLARRNPVVAAAAVSGRTSA